MYGLIKIAWRNVWRNKLRSTIVIVAIILGLWAGLMLTALSLGLNEERLKSSVETYLSHVQIHHPKFHEDYNIKYNLQNVSEIKEVLNNNPKVKAYTERSISNAMVANSSGSYGAQVFGINPNEEKNLTTISQKLVAGTYFTKFKKNPILIGQKLAKKMNAKIKSKIVITLQNTEGDIMTIAFRVEGIYKTTNTMFDEATLFVRQSDLDKIMDLNGAIHEIAIKTHSMDDVSIVTEELKNKVKKDKVETWAEISPELGYAEEMMGFFVYIFMGIVLLALAFSIINTMLMAVLERKQELGMLMSVGMNKIRVFLMIALETIFISAVATPIGMLLSYLTISYFAVNGIDLSVVGTGLESIGVSSKVHTFLPTDLYWKITLMTLLVAFISSLIPAQRALKLNPAEAVKSL